MNVAEKKHNRPFKLWQRPELEIQTTTLWDYPSQHYGLGEQGSKHYPGATPSYVIWNLLSRYTREGNLVVDPMCGSGTTLDVCKDLNRVGKGFDLAPAREDIEQADARELPLKKESVDFVFFDPPYSTHLVYSEDPRCLGKLEANTPAYFEAMKGVRDEVFRILKNRRCLAFYVCDSFKKGKPFLPLGFELFQIFRAKFKPMDILCVTRHNRTMKRRHWHTAAIEGNYFLRGFNYLFILKKEV